MKIYILRHGHAPGLAESGARTDSERPLSSLGREGVRLSVKRMLERGAKPGLVLHSPLKRAIQTADEAMALIKPKPAREEFLPLANVMSSEPLFEEVARRAKGQAEVLLIGHQPQLGELASYLTGQAPPFVPAGMAAVEVADGAAPRLLWSHGPDGGK